MKTKLHPLPASRCPRMNPLTRSTAGGLAGHPRPRKLRIRFQTCGSFIPHLTRGKSAGGVPRFRRPTTGVWLPITAALIADYFCGSAQAQTNLATAPDPSVTALSPLQPLLDGLAGKYGWLTMVILLIGSLRILFKPLMLAL